MTYVTDMAVGSSLARRAWRTQELMRKQAFEAKYKFASESLVHVEVAPLLAEVTVNLQASF